MQSTFNQRLIKMTQKITRMFKASEVHLNLHIVNSMQLACMHKNYITLFLAVWSLWLWSFRAFLKLHFSSQYCAFHKYWQFYGKYKKTIKRIDYRRPKSLQKPTKMCLLPKIVQIMGFQYLWKVLYMWVSVSFVGQWCEYFVK